MSLDCPRQTPRKRSSRMSDNHGNTPAAWTAVVIGLLAFVVAGVALMLSPITLPIFWIGMVLLPVALIVFVIMTTLALGDGRKSVVEGQSVAVRVDLGVHASI